MPVCPLRLKIDGAVARPLLLSPDDLLALPARERVVTLDCGKGTRTRLRLRGPAIAHLVDLAEASGSASRAVFYCTDGHRETISLADLIRCDAFLALPSRDAPANAGSAARLVVPGKFGDRWAKFVERIEFLE